MTEVHYILVLPLGETPYPASEGALLRHLAPPTHRRLQHLLSMEELGG